MASTAPARQRVLPFARLCVLLCVLLLGLVTAACADPPAPPVVLRLWRDVAPVAVSGPPATSSEWEILIDSDLRHGAATALSFRRIVDREGEWVPVPFELPAQGPLVLRRSSGWSLVTTLPVRSGDALAVEITVRGEGAGVGETVNVGAVVELAEPWDHERRLSGQDVLDLFDESRHASVTLEGPVRATSTVFAAEFALDSRTREVALFLTAPWDGKPERLVFERLVVKRQALSGWVAAGGTVPRLDRIVGPGGADADRSPATGAVRVRFDRDEREGLLALAPTSYAYDLPPWPEVRLLDVALGVRPEPRDPAGPAARMYRTATFKVEAGGELFFEESFTAPDEITQPAWRDRRIVLPPSPDGPLRLVLSTEVWAVGGEPPLAVWGHPTVRTPRVSPRPSGAPASPTSPTPPTPPTPAPPPTPAGSRAPHVVLICLDTLRPDRLGCYGGPAGNSPRLDALAAEGVRFTRAYSTTSYTLPSHASLMTGQFPALHGAVDVVDKLSTQRSAFLADQLARAGYVTAAFTGGGYVSTDYGFGNGFDRYSHNDPVWATETVRGAQLVNTVSWQRNPVQLDLLRRYDAEAVTDWIGSQQPDVPFFLFLHTYIVHNYAPDNTRLEARELLTDDFEQRPFDHRARTRFNAGELELRDEVYDAYMPFYDATVAMADEFVGKVLDALGHAGLADDTLVIVTSDHGEEFGEHDFFGHGETLYDSNVRIPMIARLPRGAADGALAGTVTDQPVSLVDVAPWILRVAGLEPDPRMSVRPPLGPDQVSPPGRELTFIELDTHRSRKSAVVLDELKLHVQLGENGEDLPEERHQLYDVGTDPAEEHDVFAEHDDRAALLRERLAGLHRLGEVLNPRGDTSLSLEDLEGMDPALLEQLRALGYLELLGGGTDDDG